MLRVSTSIVLVSLLQVTPAPAPVTDVRVEDPFWRARLERQPPLSVPHATDSAYLDLLEFLFTNGALGQLAVKDGRVVFQHPLAAEGAARESIEIPCCTKASALVELPAMIYASSDSTLFLNLFATSDARVEIRGQTIRVAQRTNYPWDGNIELRVESDQKVAFAIGVRIPGWARGVAGADARFRFHDDNVPAPTLLVNGQTTRVERDRGFARVSREWHRGDVVHVYFPMPVQRVLPREPTAATRGRAAIQRGPVLYAMPSPIALPLDAEVSYVEAKAPGGVGVIDARGVQAIPLFAATRRNMQAWIPF